MHQTSLKNAPSAVDLSFAEGIWPEPAHLHELMQEYGAAHLRGFYRNDPAFHAYLGDLSWCAAALMEAQGLAVDPASDLEARINALYAYDPTLPKTLYLLGTQPMQVASGNALKFSPRTMALAQAILGAQARLGTPLASDSFIGHHPGEKNQRYVLPVHQDYPYLLQSEEMITFWIPLSRPAPGLGGVTLWPTSHRSGPRGVHTNEHGHLETDIGAGEAFPQMEVEDWDLGDLVIMHGSLLHRGHHNHSQDRTRLLQVFRFTDLNQPVARKTEWASRAYARPGATYDEVLPLFTPANGPRS